MRAALSRACCHHPFLLYQHRSPHTSLLVLSVAWAHLQSVSSSCRHVQVGHCWDQQLALLPPANPAGAVDWSTFTWPPRVPGCSKQGARLRAEAIREPQGEPVSLLRWFLSFRSPGHPSAEWCWSSKSLRRAWVPSEEPQPGIQVVFNRPHSLNNKQADHPLRAWGYCKCWGYRSEKTKFLLLRKLPFSF